MLPNAGVIEIVSLRAMDNVTVFAPSADPGTYPWNPKIPNLDFLIKDKSLYKRDPWNNLIYGCYCFKDVCTLVRDDNGRPVRKDIMIPSYLVDTFNIPPENCPPGLQPQAGYFPIPHRKLLDSEDLAIGPGGMGWVIVPAKGYPGSETTEQAIFRMTTSIYNKVVGA